MILETRKKRLQFVNACSLFRIIGRAGVSIDGQCKPGASNATELGTRKKRLQFVMHRIDCFVS
jgi:hypothetical protein